MHTRVRVLLPHLRADNLTQFVNDLVRTLPFAVRAKVRVRTAVETIPLSASLTGLLTIACATLPDRNQRREPSIPIADSATRSRRPRASLRALSAAAIFVRTSFSRMSRTRPIVSSRDRSVMNYALFDTDLAL
jgi:hypothetical protein